LRGPPEGTGRPTLTWSVYDLSREKDAMSHGYIFLVLVHILLFVYWLGSDLGVFYSAKFVADPKLSLETRRTIMKIVHFIDLFPRMTLVLTLPAGATLALLGGYAPLPAGWEWPALAAVWIAGLVWLALV